MKALNQLVSTVLALQLSLGSVLAQPVMIQQNPFQAATGTGITNLRLINQSADGTEALFTMDYSYDGRLGPTVQIVTGFEKKDQKGVSAWFGADPVTVGQGRGPVSVKSKYFNDEPGVPPQLTTDRVVVLMLNQNGTVILGRTPFLKIIKWGNPNAKPSELIGNATTQPMTSDGQANAAIKLVEEKRLAEEKARTEARLREEGRAKAEAEAKARQVAEETARAEAQARQAAQLKAENEAKRLAEDRRIADAKRLAEEKNREEARLKAQAEAQRLAGEKRLADEKAKAEAEAREIARLQAEADEKARLAAETKALAEAKARDASRLKAEAEAKRLAEAKRVAEEKAKVEAEEAEKARLLAEAKAREEERVKAEAKARQLATERRLAEAKAAAEAKSREEARIKAEAEAATRAEAEAKALAEAKARDELRLKAESEAKKLAAERRMAEEKARVEALAREEARLHAEADAKRLAEERRAAEEKANIEAQARRIAEAKAREESEAKARAEGEALRLAAEKKNAQEIANVSEQALAQTGKIAASPVSLEIAPGLKSKVTNVDVVNRSLDRTQMTIGVEYEYQDSLGPKTMLGIDVLRLAEPEVSHYFNCNPAEITKSRRNFLLFPVKFQPPSGALPPNTPTFATDKVLVYLMESANAKKLNLFPTTMLLNWRVPGATAVQSSSSGSTVELEDFKQNDLYSGYVSVRYNLASGTGRLRFRIYDSAKPESYDYFSTRELAVRAGKGLQLLDVKVEPESKSPTDSINANTIEVELLDANKNVVAKLAKTVPMRWAKPKP